MRISKPFAIALAAATASCLFSDEEPGRICTAAGCDSGAELSVFEGPDGTALIEATLRVCRNAACSDARIIEIPTMEGEFSISLQGDLVGMVRVSLVASQYGVAATVREQGEYPYGFADGDVYTVELRDRDAMLLSSRAWTAMYSVLQPNGPECGPTCVRAHLEAR